MILSNTIIIIDNRLISGNTPKVAAVPRTVLILPPAGNLNFIKYFTVC